MNKIHHIFWDAVKKIFIFDFCGHIFVLKSRREVRGLGGGGVLWEFLGGDVLLGHWNP